MHPLFPAKEMDLTHMTARMFCAPVLRVDIPRVQAEYEREVTRREELLLNLLDPRQYDDILDGKDKKLEGKERDMRIVKKVVGSNERFVALFENLGIARDQLPRKLSPAWMKKNKAEQEASLDTKWAFAFAKDDLEFLAMPDKVWEYFPHLDPNNAEDALEAAELSEKLQQLIDARIAVKSTTNITRAERFLKAGANGMPLPVGYAYYRASTGRWGGNNKMNMQNLTRGGELRLSILAAPGHQIAVADSGQIEARVNAWLWDQFDLLEAFRHKRDVYSEFATDIYGPKITKEDKNDRHVGKVCVLGLGYQMGAPKLQMTLARGALGDLAAVDVRGELAVHVALVAERFQQVELIPQPGIHARFNLTRVSHGDLVAGRSQDGQTQLATTGEVLHVHLVVATPSPSACSVVGVTHG
jgi:DNA polymerase